MQKTIDYPLALTAPKTKLKDLVEFRYDRIKKAFVKVATHLTNVPDSLAYGTKNRKEAAATMYTVFVVVDNGDLQYSNEFPPHLKRRLEACKKAIERITQKIDV